MVTLCASGLGSSAPDQSSGLSRPKLEGHVSRDSNVLDSRPPGSPSAKCNANPQGAFPPDTFSTSHVADGCAYPCASPHDSPLRGNSSVLSVLLSSFQPHRTSRRPSTAPPRARQCAAPGTRPRSAVLADPPASACAATSVSTEPCARRAVAPHAVQSAMMSSRRGFPAQAAAATTGPCAESSARASGLKHRVTISTEAGVYLANEASKVRAPWRADKNDFHVRGWSRAAAYNNTVGTIQDIYFCSAESSRRSACSTVALLNIEPVGSEFRGTNTKDCSALSMCLSHRFLTQAVRYLARLR
jgi:hypothetical protein